MSRLTPVERDCPSCAGIGHVPEDPWRSCRACDGLGKTWIQGGPMFGCKTTLAKCKKGEIVTLGNGDRGRLLFHNKNGTPMTFIGLINDFDDSESYTPTMYPSATGVASVADPRWNKDDSDHVGERAGDRNDPMQRGDVLI